MYLKITGKNVSLYNKLPIRPLAEYWLDAALAQAWLAGAYSLICREFTHTHKYNPIYLHKKSMLAIYRRACAIIDSKYIHTHTLTYSKKPFLHQFHVSVKERKKDE